MARAVSRVIHVNLEADMNRLGLRVVKDRPESVDDVLRNFS